MKCRDLIMLLSYYQECEVTAPNLDIMAQASVSAIEFNPAAMTIELQTFKKKRVNDEVPAR